MPAPAPLRALTYLAPGLPLELFEDVAAHLAGRLGRPVTLSHDERHSGPMAGDHDPFAAGEADLGFVCASSYAYLSSRPAPSVRLVEAGFVFGAGRADGEPRYFSEVVVRSDDPARSLEDLRGRRFGFNDACSLSGYFSVLQALDERGLGPDHFAGGTCTGSHVASVEALVQGAVDAAAIDSNVLALLARRAPAEHARVRVVESFGPFPIQPVVLRDELPEDVGREVRDALLALRPGPQLAPAWAELGFERCAPLADEVFDDERRALARLGRL